MPVRVRLRAPSLRVGPEALLVGCPGLIIQFRKDHVGSSPTRPTIVLGNIIMPMYETTVRTPQGETKDRVYAKDLQEARMLFEQRHGPRNVPYIPKIIPS